MSIVVRRGRPVVEPRSRLLRFERPPTVDAAVAAIGRPIPEPDDRHELARLALDVVLGTSEPMNLPAHWKRVAFGREVDRARAQLAPIRTRESLVCSYGREASIAVTRPASSTTEWSIAPSPLPPSPPGPVRVAYAIRWLELGDGRARPSWASIVNGVVKDLVDAVAGDDPV